ncbi:DNA_MISMATCH_REPAIR_2 domain-containing protein, partial [Haematococcus lacustris]
GRFENASVEFDEVALAPTYRLLWGIPGRSNALNIAARLGLEEEVVAAARSRLDDSVVRADTAVAALEEVRDTVQGEESALWAVEQEVAAIQAEVTARRIEVRVLQSELAAATEKALFDVWLEARRRLRQIRQAKRAPAPAVKRALSPTQELQGLDMSMEQLLEQQIEMRHQARLMAAEKERLAEQAYDSAVMGFEQLISAMPVAPPSRQAVPPHLPPSTAVSVPNEQEGVHEEDIEELEQQFPAASVIQQQLTLERAKMLIYIKANVGLGARHSTEAQLLARMGE